MGGYYGVLIPIIRTRPNANIEIATTDVNVIHIHRPDSSGALAEGDIGGSTNRCILQP